MFFDTIKSLNRTTCSASQNDSDCCSPYNLCREGEGDCDKDADCDSGLICGYDNCLDFNSSWTNSTFDCCTQPKGTTTEIPATTYTNTEGTTPDSKTKSKYIQHLKGIYPLHPPATYTHLFILNTMHSCNVSIHPDFVSL